MSISAWKLRFLFVLPFLLYVSSVSAQVVVHRGAPRASVPGWFGPGPAFGTYVGPGIGWIYHHTPGGPTTLYSGVSYGGWYGPWWWLTPARIGDSWSNGLSLYGPPVPTYGPTPGAFGGSDADKIYFRKTELPRAPLGWAGALPPSPRSYVPTVSVQPPGTSVCRGGPAPSNQECARITVRLPHPEAMLWVDTNTTQQTGSERVFESPELAEGQTFTYRLVAQWKVDGKEKAESRRVIFSRGESWIVDFGKAE